MANEYLTLCSKLGLHLIVIPQLWGTKPGDRDRAARTWDHTRSSAVVIEVRGSMWALLGGCRGRKGQVCRGSRPTGVLGPTGPARVWESSLSSFQKYEVSLAGSLYLHSLRQLGWTPFADGTL